MVDGEVEVGWVGGCVTRGEVKKGKRKLIDGRRKLEKSEYVVVVVVVEVTVGWVGGWVK